MAWHNDGSIHGVGIGFRETHASELIQQKPDIGWLEVLSDNFFAEGGLAHQELEELRAHYPIALHSVAMSIGSIDPLDWSYLGKIQQLAKRYKPAIISDHLCFSSVDGVQLHDLIPLPQNEETVAHVGQRIRQVQDFFEQKILIENISSYLTYKESNLSDAEFINAIAQTADCGILLDLNNLYVNAYNHGHSHEKTLNAIDFDRVGQIHLGGFEDKGHYLLDAHNHAVTPAVWDMFAQFVKMRPENKDVLVLVEWDNDIPDLNTLLNEAKTANKLLQTSP